MAGLIITNGDSAAELLRLAGRQEPILAWRDVLHEGPIVAGSLAECTGVRAPWLAERFRIPLAEIEAGFGDRDAVMAAHGDFDTIELWFEHDLYDQLQLVQILSFFADAGRSDGIHLVQADDFLGNQAPDTILRFAGRARLVTPADLDLADFTWANLAMPTPETIARRVEEPMDELPYLGAALHRFLEELPSPTTGLGRTEAAALSGIASGIAGAVELFRRTLAGEEAAFMGDLSFFRILDDLAFSSEPLIAGLAPPAPDDDGSRYRAASLSLTPAGADVLAGRRDRVALDGIDRWWAGTRLLGRECWRYDRDEMKLVPPEAAGA